MKNRNLCTAIAAALGMLVLILDGKTALSGASEGISLCIATLVPSLFPFFIMSILLTGALSGHAVPFLRPVAAACRIPEGAESLLAIGFLGGYPVGAQNVALLHRSGQLSGDQAARMISFCNNAGPAFIFGILGAMFSDPKISWLLWAVHILSAVLVGILLPGETDEATVRPLSNQISLPIALEKSVQVMALVCGWVVLMRMMLAFLERWFLWLLPLSAQIAVCGILELSNGCVRLGLIENDGLRFILASGLLSLGGVCVTLQTLSVTTGITKRFYFPGKLLQCCISVLLSSILQFVFPPSMRCDCALAASAAAGIGIICLLSLHRLKKSSRIPATVGV